MRSLHASHLVLGIGVLTALGIFVLLVARTVPGGEAGRSRDEGRKTDDKGQTTEDRGQRTDDRGQRTEDRSRETAPSSVLRPSSSGTAPLQAPVPHYRYKVVKSYPHNRRFFTQGLVYEDGFVYEGTGLYGQSAIYKRDLQKGTTLKTLRLPDKYFGEGITLFGDKLIQLTWQSNVGFVYTKDAFTPLREFKYSGEGWGLTHDDKRLILSDGTSILRFLDPNTFAETDRVQVRDQSRPVASLNELEFVADGPPGAQAAWRGRPALASRGHLGLALLSQNTRVASALQGQDALVTKEQGRDALATAGTRPQAKGEGLIYANIWPTDQIVIIDPKTGRVTGWIDMAGLWTPPADEQGESVLNGIAYLPKTRHLLVTGKLWPRMYEIELVPEPQR